MLHVDSADQNFKTDWNVNESQALTPMTEGNGGNCKESEEPTLTLTCLGEPGSNERETSTVIGTQRHYIEPGANKTDVFIITSPDWKLLSANAERNSQIGFAPPIAGNEKIEILWDNSSHSTDKIKSDWCPPDKTMYETKECVHCDLPIGDTCKIWSNLGKASQGVAIDCDLEAPKIRDKSFVMSVQNVNVHDKILEGGICENSHFGLDHMITAFTPNPYLDTNSYPAGFKINFSNKGIEEMTRKTFVNNELQLKKSSDLVRFSKKKRKSPWKLNGPNGTSNFEYKPTSQVESGNCMPEKSLPLKKKAKMKETLTVMATPNKMYKYKLLSSNEVYETTINNIYSYQWIVDGSKDSAGKFFDNGSRNSLFFENGKSENKETNDRGTGQVTCTQDVPYNDCNNIYEVIGHLKARNLIDQSVWETLHTGLREMNVDILGEIKHKCNASEKDNVFYSAELKAFALMLQFQQPNAFKYLAELYKEGWPSLSVIREWKRKINRRKRACSIKRNQKK